jgi:tetratricopeptide (TPR) repeat protein
VSKKGKSQASPPARAAASQAKAPAKPTNVRIVAAVLAALTLAVFAQVRHHEFVDLDDTLYVTDNPHVTTGLTTDNAKWALTTGYGANWHPLTWLSHQLDVSLFGMDAGRHHLVSVGWHVLNTLLLFGLLRYMTGALWRPAFVAALFALHPAHVESVAWISERKDVLSTFFWFAATWAYAWWARRAGVARYALVAVLLALGLAAKPMLVTLPFTLLLLDVWPLGRSRLPLSKRIIEKLPLFALAAASSVITVIAQRGGGAVTTFDIITPAQRAGNAIVAYAEYLRMLVWPVDLAVLYPYVKSLPTGRVLTAAAIVGVVTLVAWRVRKTQPYLNVGWLWFAGTLVPVIGLVQIGLQSHADRYTYVPYTGLFIAVAWGGHALASRLGVAGRALRVAAAVLVIVAAVASNRQIKMWSSSEALWLRAVTSTRNNARAHYALGMIYARAGDSEAAATQFREALRLRPDLTDARLVVPNLGLALMAQGRIAEAIPYLERGCQLNPRDAVLRHRLALAYVGVDRATDAIASWQEAVRIDPNFEEAYFTMGMILAANARVPEAREAFMQVLRLSPGRLDAAQALKALGGR